jgi:hypothetical protein
MNPKTYTFTVRRAWAWTAGAVLTVTVATVVVFGPHAWLINAGLVLLAALLMQTTLRVRSGGGQVTTTSRYVDDRPSADAQAVADAIQTASIRDWVLRDMGGQR